MEAYLDNSATTRCLESVADIVRKNHAGRLWKSFFQAFKRRRSGADISEKPGNYCENAEGQ